jgi:hypothetical protein
MGDDLRDSAENSAHVETLDTVENSFGTLEFETIRPLSGTGRRRWRNVVVTTMIALVIALLLVLAARGSLNLARPAGFATRTSGVGTAQPYPTPFEAPPVSALGPAPVRCPAAAEVGGQMQKIRYNGAPAFGGSPVWVVGLSDEPNRPAVHFERYPTFPPLPYTAHGWRWRFLLVSPPSYGGIVRLSGNQLGAGGNTALLMDAGAGLTANLSLNASQPMMRGVSWAEWPIYVYLPKPGCYEIDARWSGGSWRLPFAAGV